MDIWSWLSDLPNSTEWSDSNLPLIFPLTPSQPQDEKSILLKAERTSGSNTETLVTFSICIQGFNLNSPSTLWVSDACPLSSNQPFLPLLLQLLQEIFSRSPNSHDTTCPRSQLQKLRPEPISWIVDSHSPESFSDFFNLVFLCRLFWLCVCDSHFEVGEVYFKTLLAPNFNLLSCRHVVRNFLISIGVDAELCFMRTVGYIIAKWFMLRDMGAGLQLLTPLQANRFSYSLESHGLWILKGYTPVLSMTRTRSPNELLGRVHEAKESVLRYTLAHQQLEAVIQLEYSICFHDNFIQVNTRVNNIRLHVVKLGFNKNEDQEYVDEIYFPSRIRVWVGPEVGSTYVASLSLSRSTGNPEKEIKTQKTVKGNMGKAAKVPVVKAVTKTSTRAKTKNWRWEQDSEGNAAVFEGVLHDGESGLEVAMWKPGSGGETPMNGMRKRYTGGSRVFNKNGGLIIAGDEHGEWVSWRLSKEMEGSMLKWRIGGKVWLSYWPNEVKSNYFETRCIDWCDEVDLPLIQGK